MVGGGCLRPKISAGPDESKAEEGTPGPVDDNPVSYWVFRADHPTGEFQTVGRFLIDWQAEHFGYSRWYDMFWVGVFSTMTQYGGSRIIFRALEHDQGVIGAGQAFAQLGDWVWFPGSLFPGKVEVTPGSISIFTDHYCGLCIGKIAGMPVLRFWIWQSGHEFPTRIRDDKLGFPFF